MTSLSVDNKVQEETTKNLLRRHERGKANGKKEEKKKLKGDKGNTKIKAKGKCKSSGKFSLPHSTQRNLLL
jgi:hypothetical protein